MAGASPWGTGHSWHSQAIPMGHRAWLAWPRCPCGAQSTAGTATMSPWGTGHSWQGHDVPVGHRAWLARQGWPCQGISWISSSQGGQHGHRGSCRPRGGLEARGRGDHRWTRGLCAAAACGQRFSQAQSGLVEPGGVLGGVPARVGTPGCRWVACLEGGFAKCMVVVGVCCPCPARGAPAMQAFARSRRAARPPVQPRSGHQQHCSCRRQRHGRTPAPWALAMGRWWLPRQRLALQPPTLRAGQCRQLPVVPRRAEHAGQTAARHSRGGWWLQPLSNNFPTHGSLAKTNADSGQPESLVSQK